MAENNATSSGTQASSAPSIRQKKDVAWKYVTEGTNAKGKKIWICGFCKKIFAGGGINRMKQHLSGVKGTVTACQKVSLEVQLEINDLLDAHAQKSKAKKAMAEDLDAYKEDEILKIPSQTEVSNGKRKASYAIDSFCQKGVSLSSQPSIKACMQSKDKWKDTDLAIALWFYDACIPFNACTSPYFQAAINKIASMGHGYTHPSYHALRVNLLNDAKTHVTLMIDSIRDTWADIGCTIMGDGWTDIRQRSLINFLVYCPKGISFIKFVDASDQNP